MPPLPVITGVVRLTWNFAPVAGVTPRIVQHLFPATTNMEDLGGAISDSATEGLFGPMLAGHEPETVSLLPLDGTSPTYEASISPTDPLCLGTGQMMPAVCALVQFKTGQRGPRGRGRSFVGPIVEQANLDGVLDAATRTNLEDAWINFSIGLSSHADGALLTVASYTHEDHNLVTNLTVDNLVATQRRRQDQLR